jgi:hypothetical protein
MAPPTDSLRCYGDRVLRYGISRAVKTSVGRVLLLGVTLLLAGAQGPLRLAPGLPAVHRLEKESGACEGLARNRLGMVPGASARVNPSTEERATVTRYPFLVRGSTAAGRARRYEGIVGSMRAC